MATKMENLDLEIAHFDAFKEHLPGFETWDKSTLQKMLEMGIVEVSTCFEMATANVGGFEVISADEADFSNGGDGKLTSVRHCNYGKTYAAPVKSIHNKTGPLYVQCYERIKNKYYWFVLPYETYCHIPKTSNIEIPFELDGTPRRINNKTHNPWLYEARSFEDMANGITVQNRKDIQFNTFYEAA